MTYIIGKTNKPYNMLTYNWFNTSSYTTFFVTSIGTPLLLQMSAYNLEGDETRNSEHQVGYDWTHALEGAPTWFNVCPWPFDCHCKRQS